MSEHSVMDTPGSYISVVFLKDLIYHSHNTKMNSLFFECRLERKICKRKSKLVIGKNKEKSLADKYFFFAILN